MLYSQLASAPTINQSTGVGTTFILQLRFLMAATHARLSASDGARTTTRLVDFALNFTFAVQEMLWLVEADLVQAAAEMLEACSTLDQILLLKLQEW